MKTLYLECNMGAAGDMLMAALYELLPDGAAFLHTMDHLLPHVHVEAIPAKTCGIVGTKMSVTVHGHEEGHHHDHDHHHHHHATPVHIAGLIDGLALPDSVKANAHSVYNAIAQAEALAHGCPVGDVHFHEVGALDAVADVVGVCLALHLLGPDQILVSPVHVGAGHVGCAHGVVPVPAPATARLLAGIPTYGGELQGELCTPTGAALLAHFGQSFGPMPVMAVGQIGYGLGTKEFERANCVRAFWGARQEEPHGEITELVCNLDDMTPEALAYACAKLLELGALDVYTVAGTMKKGRSGWVLTVLCDPAQEQELAVHVLRETTTNGLRVRRCGKYYLTPRTETVNGVTTKIAEGYGITHRKAEFEAAARIARETGRPIWEVLAP